MSLGLLRDESISSRLVASHGKRYPNVNAQEWIEYAKKADEECRKVNVLRDECRAQLNELKTLNSVDRNANSQIAKEIKMFKTKVVGLEKELQSLKMKRNEYLDVLGNVIEPIPEELLAYLSTDQELCKTERDSYLVGKTVLQDQLLYSFVLHSFYRLQCILQFSLFY